MRFDSPAAVMRRALELARRGLGAVEPNPPVGAVLVNDRLEFLGEGWHRQFGGPHAEIAALEQAGAAARGSTLFVTLEPCCHHGKTPPCTQAVNSAGVGRVVVAARDPNPLVAGKGLEELAARGVVIEAGLLQSEADALIAPFRKLITAGRPWMISKWAMTLDGKVAAYTGDARWISGDASQRVVHELRGRVDAILVGIGTVLADDPLLTARPAGVRTAVRVVIDSQARLPRASQLVSTARRVPVLVAAVDSAPSERVLELQSQGVEVIRFPADEAGRVPLGSVCDELGRRRMTNVLAEGGSRVFGTLFDQHLIDEVYAFVAPKLIGGETSPTPIAGAGLAKMNCAQLLCDPEIRTIGGDVLIHGRLKWTAPPTS